MNEYTSIPMFSLVKISHNRLINTLSALFAKHTDYGVLSVMYTTPTMFSPIETYERVTIYRNNKLIRVDYAISGITKAVLTGVYIAQQRRPDLIIHGHDTYDVHYHCTTSTINNRLSRLNILKELDHAIKD